MAEPVDIREAGDRRAARYSDRREMANEDLRALIGSERAARERDQHIYDERIAAFEAKLSRVEAKLDKVVNRVLVFAGGFAVLIFLANWVGPSVIRRVIDSLFVVTP